MKTNLSLQTLLENYVFAVADRFIEEATPVEQDQLLRLFSDIAKTNPSTSVLTKLQQKQQA